MNLPQSPGNYRARIDRIATYNEQQLREKLYRLTQAIDPEAKCVCSDLSQVQSGEEVVCAYHSTRIGWIIHTARKEL